MENKQMICITCVVYLFALLSMVVEKSNVLLETIVYSPLIFLNFVLAMLLISVGQQLYQKNF